MKNILVLVRDYPSENSHELMYVHVRNKYYVKNGMNVDVLNFHAKEDYNYDDINVLTLDTYKKKNKNYDILICHAANIRSHYFFLNKYEKNFKKIIFFYHGHEILKSSEVYPEEYPWIKKKAPDFIRNIYDDLKFILWKNKIQKLLYKSHLVFVSNWLYYRFLYYIHINPKKLENKISIINNSVGEIFEKENYSNSNKKNYDFITIRGVGLDSSKYGIDIVNQLAHNHPNNTFLVIGKGKFFDYAKKPSNLTFLNKSLNHKEMLEYLDSSRCALLPTKEDTQGVMTCEMFTYGIPTITSDIEVCREIFSDVSNVKFIDNNNLDKVDLNQLLAEMENIKFSKNEKYFKKNTINKEIELINKI